MSIFWGLGGMSADIVIGRLDFVPISVSRTETEPLEASHATILDCDQITCVNTLTLTTHGKWLFPSLG